MSKEILFRAFKKAKEDIGSSRKTHLSTHLSDVLEEKYGLFINERTLRDYYTNFKKNEDDYFTELKPRLIERLCNYLGYGNYANFVLDNPEEKCLNVADNRNFFSKAFEYFKAHYRPVFTNIISFISLGLSIYFGIVRESKNYTVLVNPNHLERLTSGPLEKVIDSSIFEELEKIEKIDSITTIANKGTIIWHGSSNENYDFIADKGSELYYHQTMK